MKLGAVLIAAGKNANPLLPSGDAIGFFLMDADYPLVDPDALVDMLASAENMVLPCFGGQNGQPLLIKSSCAHRGCTASDMAAMAALPGFVSLPVEDIGVILPATEAEKNFIADHERKLTRLVSEFTISREKSCWIQN